MERNATKVLASKKGTMMLQTHRVTHGLLRLAMIGGLLLFLCRASAQDADVSSLRSEKRNVLVQEPIARISSADKLDAALALNELIELGVEAAPAIPTLLDTLEHRDHTMRGLAVQALVAIGDESVEPLRRQLVSESTTARHLAAVATALGRLNRLTGDDLKRLASNEDPRVRAVAAQFANNIKDSAATHLIALLRDPETAVAVSAAAELEFCDQNRELAVDALIGAMSDPTVGKYAATTLSKYGMTAQRAIPALIEFEAKTSWRFDVDEALEHIGPPHLDDIEALCELLKHENIEVQMLASETLALLRAEAIEAAPALEMAAMAAADRYLKLKRIAATKPEDERHYDNSGRVFVAAEYYAEALLQITSDADRFIALCRSVAEKTDSPLTWYSNSPWAALSEDSLPRIQEMLEHSSVGVRWTALDGISAIGSRASPLKDHVMSLLDDEDTDIRAQALVALTAMGPDVGSDVGPGLITAYRNQELPLREFARAIEQLAYRSQEAQMILEDGLNDAERWTPHACSDALAVTSQYPQGSAELIIEAAGNGRIHMRSAIETLCKMDLEHEFLLPFLIDQLGDSDAWTPHDAARALGQIGPPARKAVEELTRMLDDEHLETKLEAASAIYLITGDPEPFGDILEKVSATEGRDSSRHAYQCIQSITELGSKGAPFEEFLLKEYREGDPRYLDNVITALGAIGSPKAIQVLQELATSNDWAIRSQAIQSLKTLANTGNEGSENED